MKYLIVFLFICLSWSCTIGTSQSVSKEQMDEVEFGKLMDNVANVKKESNMVQDAATKQQVKMINKAAETITNLKAEVSELKQELHEVKAKLDSANNIDNSKPFSIRGAGS